MQVINVCGWGNSRTVEVGGALLVIFDSYKFSDMDVIYRRRRTYLILMLRLPQQIYIYSIIDAIYQITLTGFT